MPNSQTHPPQIRNPFLSGPGLHSARIAARLAMQPCHIPHFKTKHAKTTTFKSTPNPIPAPAPEKKKGEKRTESSELALSGEDSENSEDDATHEEEDDDGGQQAEKKSVSETDSSGEA